MKKMHAVLIGLLLIMLSTCFFGCQSKDISENDMEKLTTTETIESDSNEIDTTAEKAEDKTASIPQEEELREYLLLDGKVSIKLSEEKYDVFQSDNTDNQLALSRQGLSQEIVDMSMQLSGYDLRAVPVGDSLLSSKIELRVNLKPDKYPEIGTLKELSRADKEAVAAAIVASFPVTDGYKWYVTDSADYFVFDTVITVLSQNEIRYATIVDGCMAYIFIKNSEGEIDESLRLELQNIVDTVEFFL